MAFTWTKDLETGNAQIDSEHKQLIRAADELVEACGQGKGSQELVKAVEFLSNYTQTHFSHEEQLQIKCNYPEYQTHKAWHQSFLNDFGQVAAKLKAEGATIALVAEVNTKVSQVLMHIKTMDTQLARYIQSKA